MIRRSLDLIVSRDEEGGVSLGAPAVGLYTASRRTGEGVVSGSVAGTLVVLGRTVDLLIPPGVEGTILEAAFAGCAVPVAYGEILARLEPADPAPGSAAKRASAVPSRRTASSGGGTDRVKPGRARRTKPRPGPDTEEDLPDGTFALRAPTTGIFYARPDPASAPFVSAGSLLTAGQTAGLIEVMKCFSPIVHPGGAIPSPACIEEVRVSEGEGVRPRQILFVLRPA